jgi:hypothetical protein
VTEQPDLRGASRAFIEAAFRVLKEEHVIPTPIFHPYVSVGRDYFGPTLMPLPEYDALEAQLNAAYPERFAEPLKRRHPEFASTYMFSFLGACVARCARTRTFEPTSQAIDESIDELLAVLGRPAYEVVTARHVSHLTTNGAEVQIGNVMVVPEPSQPGGLIDRIRREIPAAARAWNRRAPFAHDPPNALLITRQITDDPEPYEVGHRLSARLERFLLVARLLTAGTVQSAFEVSGPTTLVARMEPVMTTIHRRWWQVPIRRTVHLTGEEGKAFAALGGLIDAANIRREGMVVTSFDVALDKLNRSYGSDRPFTQLIDLMTALEAALIGTEKEAEGLTLRLRSRVATLLAMVEDPGQTLFDDVTQLYRLRSLLVHGGRIKERDLRRIVARISTVPAGAARDAIGVAVSYALDRMRDLVRRAILARLCLASDPDPLWPFDKEIAIDAILAGDAERAAWRAYWHERLAGLGVDYAAGPPRSAVEFFSPEDR